MGSVIVTLRVMPKSVKTDLSIIEEQLRKKINPQRMERVPIAFGLVSLEVIKLVEEEEGKVDELIEKMKSIQGVKGVEVINITRSL